MFRVAAFPECSATHPRVLRSRKRVEIHVDAKAILARPTKSLEEVRPGDLGHERLVTDRLDGPEARRKERESPSVSSSPWCKFGSIWRRDGHTRWGCGPS